MKIYNAFGIKPTNTHVSAGSDYYIPNIDDFDVMRSSIALKAFEKSYNVSGEDIKDIRAAFEELADPDETNQITNMIHLFLALGNKQLDELKEYSLQKAVNYFYEEYVLFDDSGKVGIKLKLNDTLFINSGIKVALDTILSEMEESDTEHPNIAGAKILRDLGIGIAGLYVNKSGMGNKGWDVRACLVDEDYAGYVHLSMAYTKNVYEDEFRRTNAHTDVVFAGDKLVQMMLIPVFHTIYEEINEAEYINIMKNSKRGDSGFGSSDVKH